MRPSGTAYQVPSGTTILEDEEEEEDEQEDEVVGDIFFGGPTSCAGEVVGDDQRFLH